MIKETSNVELSIEREIYEISDFNNFVNENKDIALPSNVSLKLLKQKQVDGKMVKEEYIVSLQKLIWHYETIERNIKTLKNQIAELKETAKMDYETQLLDAMRKKKIELIKYKNDIEKFLNCYRYWQLKKEFNDISEMNLFTDYNGYKIIEEI